MTAAAAIAALDRLTAAMKAGAPDHHIAQLRAAYDQAEARYLAHLDAWINVVGGKPRSITLVARTTTAYDGPCFTCDGWIHVGDHIGRTQEGGWTCERCLP